MKTFLLVTLVAIVSNAWAMKDLESEAMMGDGAGNGGDVAFCSFSDTNSFSGIYTLDYLLTFQKRNNNEDVDGIIKGDWHEYAEAILNKFKMISPEMGVTFKEFVEDTDNYTDESRYRIWRDASHGLIDIQDETMFKKLPENCRSVQQAVIRIDYGHSIEYYMDTLVQMQLLPQPLQYSMLMIHEFARDYSNDTRVIRRFVRYLHSKSFLENDKLTKEQFSRILKKMSIIKTAEIEETYYTQDQLNKNLLNDIALGNMYYVKEWLKLGADPMARDENANTTLMQAVKTGDVNIVKFAIDLGNFVPSVNRFGEDALMHAARLGNIGIADLLIEHGADVTLNEPTENADALGIAVGNGHFEFAKNLIENHNANILDSFNKDGCPIFVVAFEQDNYEFASYLVDKGADPDVEYNGLPPILSSMIELGALDQIKILLLLGADPNNFYQGEDTPLELAIGNYSNFINYTSIESITKLLVRYGADINSTVGRYPSIIRALDYNDLPEFLLVSLNADPNLVFDSPIGNEITPLMYVARYYTVKQAKILMDNGALASWSDAEKNTVLHHFAKRKEFDLEVDIPLLKYFLKMGAKLNAYNSAEKMPIDIAKERNAPPIIIELLTY